MYVIHSITEVVDLSQPVTEISENEIFLSLNGALPIKPYREMPQ